MWNALNTGKERLDLDLRDPAQRSSLIALAGDCDLIIDSFSPRVMPNFGLSPFPAPGPTALSMPAFPPGPYRQWVAYGSGIHAWSGLGDCGDETYAPPLVSYPDPIGGLTGALAAVAAIVGRDRGFAAERMEVPLASATQPLLACTALMEPAGARRSPGAALLSAGLAAGAFDMRDVAGSALAHPLSLFADPGAGTSA
jgi:crotonobetainyl-CoA:carnitine CoA-transferase CaiB-like acyl-CoA transferase